MLILYRYFLQVSSDYAYVADWNGGLAVFKICERVDFETPIITNSSSDIIEEVGYTGCSISWIASDTNPFNFTIILVGNNTAEESVQITEEGRVMGDIRAPRVILADGASFSGNVDMGEFDVEQVVEQDAERAAPSKKEPASKGARFAEKSDGEKASARETTQETQPRSTASSSRARATRSRPSAKSPAYATSARVKKKSAPVPRVRAIGRTKAKKKNLSLCCTKQ